MSKTYMCFICDLRTDKHFRSKETAESLHDAFEKAEAKAREENYFDKNAQLIYWGEMVEEN